MPAAAADATLLTMAMAVAGSITRTVAVLDLIATQLATPALWHLAELGLSRAGQLGDLATEAGGTEPAA